MGNQFNLRGIGKQYFSDGSFYHGSWENDVASGKGRLIHSDGELYEGEWKNDKSAFIFIYNNQTPNLHI